MLLVVIGNKCVILHSQWRNEQHESAFALSYSADHGLGKAYFCFDCACIIWIALLFLLSQ